MRLYLNIFILIIFVLPNSSGQGVANDPYATFSVNFIKSINKKTIQKLKENFNDSLQNDSLIGELERFKADMLMYSGKLEYHTVKIDKPYNYYVITIYNHDLKEQFGELRLVFYDEKDFLIDDWVYFNKSEMLDTKKDTTSLNKTIPLPPLPPK